MKKWGVLVFCVLGAWIGCSSEEPGAQGDLADAEPEPEPDAGTRADARADAARDAARPIEDARSDADATSDPEDATSDAGGTSDAGDAGACRTDAVDHAGTSVAIGDITALSTCSHGLVTPARWATLASADFSVDVCNACARVSGALGSAVVTLIERCNGTCGGHALEVDQDTLAEIGGAGAGPKPISWHLAPCDPAGNVRYDLESGDEYYVKLRISNHTNPLAGVEMREAGGAFQVLTRTADNYWVFQGAGPYALPLEVRATDSFEQTIVFEVASFQTGLVVDTPVQFARGCAP